ncbi:MAG: acyl-CoA dehydrogenase family protein [Chitinophagales bacterium]|nr:acyl-CoA dehydrogenase family protein [Chitinophagales bacterium]
MTSENLIQSVTKGGEFLIKETSTAGLFIPEEINEEQKMIVQMARDFMDQEILPVADRLEHQEPGLAVELLNKAGELGLLGASIPEEYGGSNKDYVTTTFITEVLGSSGAWAVSMSAHTGIGTLPILYFGTESQKRNYLPRLATGELKAAYCLTEPGSGSDALAAKTTATLSDDKQSWIINGQKMWITNGGFADIFIVFAKIDGEQFSAFIVEASAPGVSRGEEEKKMGIKGSSTRQIFFQEVKISVENLLGEAGKGHLIAFNILNIGRHRLAAAAVGGSKRLSDLSVQYAIQREQFRKPIASFGAIQYKLAEQAVRIFVNESALYRLAADIENLKTELLEGGKQYHEALMGAAEEYAIECAILKVSGSEMVDYVVDETVQIYGGIGFSEEYAPARAYRDARINRIFEGTNEINRLLSIDMLLKRVMKGKLDLMAPAMAVQKELMSIPKFADREEKIYGYEKKLLANMKKAFLMTAGAAVQKLGTALSEEQEIIMNAADMQIEIYLFESALLRVEKLSELWGTEKVALYEDILRVWLHDSMLRIEAAGRNAIESFAEGDELRMLLMGLKRFTKQEPFNCKNARRKIAARLVSEGRYCF